jgi:hypothetical protein
MQTLTSTKFFTFFRYAKSAALGLALFAAACGEAGANDALDAADVLESIEASSVDQPQAHVEVVDIQFHDAEEAELTVAGVEEIGDAWVDDCNLCILTEDGATCTAMACDDADSSGFVGGGLGSCLDGEYEQGEMWLDDCNTCLCTEQGAVCTVKACAEQIPH